jgi:proteasome lid subunit RPN8/RPN11
MGQGTLMKNSEFVEEEKKSVVFIESNVWKKICDYFDMSKQEVGGLLVVDDSDGIRITDVIFPKQSVSFATVELDMKTAMTELVQNSPDVLPKIKGWIHSHSDFGCFWSGRDKTTTNNLLEYGLPYCISIVGSRYNGEMYFLIKVSVKKPRMDFDGLNFIIVDGNSVYDKDKEMENFKKNVKQKIYRKNKKEVWYAENDWEQQYRLFL